MMVNRVLALLMLVIVSAVPLQAEAGGKGKIIAQAVQKKLSLGNWGGRVEQARARDLVRDRAATARPLAKDRVVSRFTSKNQAVYERQHGLDAGMHMTSREMRPGRVPSSGTAMKTYGLKSSPEVREQVRIPKGALVKVNKAYGGKPGIGEITLAERLPPKSVERVIPLSPGRVPE
jgi:hypothetical protein